MNSIVDFHTHILPHVDDGSANVEMSLDMLRRQAEQSVRAVVATPHFYPRHDVPEAFLQRRADAMEQLRKSLPSEAPAVYVGAEVAYYHAMANSDALQTLCIGKSSYLMVELPGSSWTSQMYRELAEIKNNFGITPVIAHLDRYLRPLSRKRVISQLSALPVLVQLNAGAFLHRSTASVALRLLKEGKAHLLGSDCHDLTGRAPNMAAAVRVIEKSLGAEAIRRINHYEDLILEG